MVEHSGLDEGQIDHDALFKEVIGSYYIEFMELFFPAESRNVDWTEATLAGTETIRKFSKVRRRKRRYADLTIRAKDHTAGSAFLIHIEVQEQVDKLAEFPPRMFNYMSRLHEKHQLPVFPIVVFSFEEPVTEQRQNYELKCLGKEILSFRYEAVQLNRLNWRDYAEKLNPVAVALTAKMPIGKEDRPHVKLKLIITLDRLQISRSEKTSIAEFIETYLRLTPEEKNVFDKMLQASGNKGAIKMVTSWTKKGREEGLAEGREEGLVEGREEGRLEGQQLLVIRLLTKRFGSLPPAISDQIKATPLEQIEQLGVALLDFGSMDDLLSWLGQRQQEE